MADLDEEADNRFDDIDVDSILARVERRGPLTFSRKRCLYQAPEFVKRLSGEDTVEEGSTVRFECKVVGFPKPKTKWFRDEDPLENNSRIKIEVGENGSYAIIVENASKCDEGAYRCLAENPEGSSSSTFYVTVKAKSSSRSPKKRSKSPHNRSVSFLPLCPTIIEKVTEEDVEENKYTKQPESPLSHLYDGLTLRSRSFPDFLGDWAFVRQDTSKEDAVNYIDENKQETQGNELRNGENDEVEKKDREKDEVRLYRSLSEPTSKEQKQKENYSSLSPEKELDDTDISVCVETNPKEKTQQDDLFESISPESDSSVRFLSENKKDLESQAAENINKKITKDENIDDLSGSAPTDIVNKETSFSSSLPKPMNPTNQPSVSKSDKPHSPVSQSAIQHSSASHEVVATGNLCQKDMKRGTCRHRHFSDLLFDSSLWEFALVLSACTLTALTMDMPGHLFVLCVLGGFILYHAINVLLQWLENL